MLSQDFKEFIKLLNENKVEYLVVGGYAVGVHGHPRYTGDLDIWINPTPDNAKKIIRVLNDFGFSSFNIDSADLVKEGNVIQLGYPPIRIDLINQLDGVVFESCIKNKFMVIVDDLEINFIGLEDLKKNKKATGRHRDIDDLENLQ